MNEALSTLKVEGLTDMVNSFILVVFFVCLFHVLAEYMKDCHLKVHRTTQH